jgi:hypothetical protein
MKRTRIITKAGVIEALKKEPLTTGSFFKERDGVIEAGCEVCAVGAVLRRFSFEKMTRSKGGNLHKLGEQATQYSYMDYDPDALLEDGNYLGALSCFFEDAGRDRKRRSIEFVKKNFPNSFRLTLEVGES